MQRWKCFIKLPRSQPASGSYSEWKEQIAADCDHQCVYCCITVARNGGIDHFHVEHFRPKSKFPEQINNIANLYLACAICNRFKSNDWPASPQPNHSIPSYPDPSQSDYNSLFSIDGHIVHGRAVAASYVVERLYLNRPQLIRERRLASLQAEAEAVVKSLQAIVAKAMSSRKSLAVEPNDLILALSKAIELQESVIKAFKCRPYELSEIQRPPKRK